MRWKRGSHDPIARGAPIRPRPEGYALLLMLLAVFLIGLALAAVAEIWRTTAVRSKEEQLLFAGNEFRRAIAQYYARNTKPNERYPRALEDLLADPNQPVLTRYLRRIYPDPFTGKADWGLVQTPDGRIMGVYSLAAGVPVKAANFPPDYSQFADTQSYADWKFVYLEQAGGVAQAGVTGQPAPGDSAVSPTAPGLAQPSAPGASPAQPPGDPRRMDCSKIAALDAETCRGQQLKWGNAEECLDSARARANACASGLPLPWLSLRYN